MTALELELARMAKRMQQDGKRIAELEASEAIHRAHAAALTEAAKASHDRITELEEENATLRARDIEMNDAMVKLEHVAAAAVPVHDEGCDCRGLLDHAPDCPWMPLRAALRGAGYLEADA